MQVDIIFEDYEAGKSLTLTHWSRYPLSPPPQGKFVAHHLLTSASPYYQKCTFIKIVPSSEKQAIIVATFKNNYNIDINQYREYLFFFKKKKLKPLL